MATYRNIKMSFWTDQKVNEHFSPYDKLVYLYLLTCPSTSLCGCYEIGLRHISFDTGLSVEEVKQTLDTLENVHDVIRYSEETNEVLILNWIKHIHSGSEKTEKGILKGIEEVKNPEFKRFLEEYVRGIDGVCKPHTRGIDGVYMPHVCKETDNDTVTDNDTENENGSVSDETDCRTQASDVQRAVDLWNTLKDTGISPVSRLTDSGKRKRLLKARLKEYGFDSYEKAIERIRGSDFLRGKNNRGWMVTFDWFLLPSNFAKVLDGNYENKTSWKDEVI